MFLLGCASRLLFLNARGPWLPADSYDYLLLAQNIREHGAFSLEESAPFAPTIRRAPLYPVFLVPFVSDGAYHVPAITIVQALLDAASAGLILYLALFVMDLRWAFVAALFYALHPGAIFFSISVLAEPLFVALTLIGLLALLEGIRKDRLLLSTLAGLLFGLAIICRPIFLPIDLLFVTVLLFIRQLPRRRLHAISVAALIVLSVSPWVVRCSRLAQNPVFVQGMTPTIFYLSTRIDMDQMNTGTLWTRFLADDPYGRRLDAAKTPKEIAEADRYGFRLALQNIRANPSGYLKSRLKHFPYLFITSFDMFSGINQSFSSFSGNADLFKLSVKIGLLLVFSLLPLLLGIVGVLGNWRNLAALFCGTIWIYTSLIHIPMVFEYRYLLPAVPFQLISAASGAELLFRWSRQRFSDRIRKH